MTTKEALQCLYIGVGKAYTGRDIYEAKYILEQELKVLQVLKRNLHFAGCCIDFYNDEANNINTKEDTTDYEIIKEWLENGEID